MDLLNWDSVHDHSDRTFYISHRAHGKALDAMRRFALPQAKAELRVAQEIDPSLADVKTLLQASEFLTELGLNAKTRASGLARAWTIIRDTRSTLAGAVHSILETLTCERIQHLLPADYADFVDSAEKSLHVGYCCLVLNRFEEAHRKLLDYLTSHSEESHPRLWGYFGDACYKLHRHDECNSGYLRALFMDAQAVDIKRMRHPDLQRIFDELRKQHPDKTARALLPIHTWLEKVLHIPKANTWLAQVIREQKFDHSRELLLYPAQRYRQFALCLYIDQSGLHGDIDFDARVEMQRLDGGLFRRYLEGVAKLEGNSQE
ncbi:hypothetical protein IH824_14785 [candidate division KSB1 bacterium]|nr:hypothetical protein [candidate division KSB1 bacterium]